MKKCKCGNALIVPMWKICQKCEKKERVKRIKWLTEQNKRKTRESHQQILTLWDKGVSVDEIAYFIPCTKTKVNRVINEHL